MYQAGILTMSDKGARGERVDVSGEVIREILTGRGFEVKDYKLIPDDYDMIRQELIRMADDEKLDLVLTTGGTGFSLRDVTPEATRSIMTRDVPGISEAMRLESLKITKRAMLSRAVSVLRGNTLIINLPGSPKACRENLECVIDTVVHGLDILTGRDGECAVPDKPKEGHHHEHR